MKDTVFITGGSSGFGKACAEKFARNGYRVAITGRRADKLQEIKQYLQERYQAQVLCLPFDVQNREEVMQAVANMPEDWKQVNVLINNAGLALGRDLFNEAVLSDWDTMLDTNVNGLIYVTKALLPGIMASGKGHIINIASIAGKEIYEKGNVYCASKAAVLALSKSMRIDLLPHRIKVTSINPGAAETEFGAVRFKGDMDAAAKVYEGYQPLTATDVSDIIYYCTTLPPHVCINDLDVTCLAQANAYYTFRE